MAGLEFRTRSRGQLACVGIVIALVLLASGWERVVAGIQDESLAERVDIDVKGVPASRAGLISFWFTAADRKSWQLSTYQSPLHWRTDSWLPAFQLSAPQSVLHEIGELRITTGGTTSVLPGAEIAGWHPTTAPRSMLPITSEPIVTVEVPVEIRGPIHMVNWPRARTLSGEVLKSLLWFPAIAAIVLLFPVILRKQRIRQFLVRSFTAPVNAHAASRGWAISGFLFVALCLAILELRQPFYFTQDDNYAQFLPVISGACRAVFTGHMPVWNPAQFMGSPVMTLGVYALTYPFTYVAWLLSRSVFGDENLTIEIFAIGHIVAGYFVTTRVLRAIGLRPALSSMGAVCFVLSGFSLILGRSWYYMLPVLVWVPALVLAVEKLKAAKAGWRWAISTGLIIGLFFHSGNAQMWCYGLMFFMLAIAVFLTTGNIRLKNALWGIPALLLGVAIASPVLLLQMTETSNIDRKGGLGASIGSAIIQTILPLGSLVAHPDVWGGYLHSPRGEMFYLGLPFAVSAIAGGIALAMSLILFRWDWQRLRQVLARNVWLICALLAWVLASGKQGLLWQIMAYLPVLDKFNVPGKFLGFMSLFAVIGGGLLIERNLARRNAWGTWGLSLCGFGLMLPHVFLSVQSFYDYGAPPYPALPRDSSAVLRQGKPGRVMAIGPERSEDPRYVESLRNNFPTAAGLYAIGGYDPLVSTRPEDIEAEERLDVDTVAATAAYGVRRVVVYQPGLAWRSGGNSKFWPMEVTSPKDRRLLAALMPVLDLVSRNQYTSIYELRNSAPLAFVAGPEQREIPVSMDWSGVRVHTAGLAAGTRVVINVLGRPFMRMQSGISWTPDEWGRITFGMPAAVDDLSLTYSPPWGKGLAAGFILALLSLGSGMALSRVPSRSQVRRNTFESADEQPRSDRLIPA